jgi:hypothetical protein
MRTETDTQTAVTGSDAAAIAYQPESCPPPPSVRTLIAGASDVYKALEDIRGTDREHLMVFDLNVRHRVLQRRTVHIGTLTGLECHPREVFKPAIIPSPTGRRRRLVCQASEAHGPIEARANGILDSRFAEPEPI